MVMKSLVDIPLSFGGDGTGAGDGVGRFASAADLFAGMAEARASASADAVMLPLVTSSGTPKSPK